jgi:hypothetical protein
LAAAFESFAIAGKLFAIINKTRRRQYE